MRRYWIPLFWLQFALVGAIQTWLSMITHGHSIARLTAHQLCVWMAWALFTPVVLRLSERFPLVPPGSRNILVHSLAAVVITVVHSAFWIEMTVLIRPYDAMGISNFWDGFPYAALARLPLEIILYCGAAAVGHSIQLSRRTHELERSLAQSRLHALELQIQPHFLFNTLNAISALVRARQNGAAVEVIAGLSDLLRYTLDHAGQQHVSLEQETDMLQRYLNIQQVRFPDRLDVTIDIASDSRRAAVPTLILQPLAENAIRHGIARAATAGRVNVRAYRQAGLLHIEMFNTGSLAARKRNGIGLQNTEERLQRLYGDAHRFALEERDGGVVAEISIPWSEVA